ncbi:unnamed protein product [Menidia menidia]|uniref:(Atlantic silverside) hypothetical protein n=1 Tax=Menidia menidia TaxID=238744 RepID=A0A8S4AA46_9TELE|nr:unnamed protein product [Menidia menidia]
MEPPFPDSSRRGPRNGGQTEDPHGQRETQQEHHAERKRSQDAATTGGEVPRGSLAAGPICICSLRISYIPDYPKHSNGDVTQKDAVDPPAHPHALSSLSPPPLRDPKTSD